MKTCATCGAAFAATGKNHRYCSRACRPSDGPAHPDGRRPCETCGTVFTRTNYCQRYCSPPCRPTGSPAYPMQKYAERLGRPLLPRGGQPNMAKRARVAELRAAGLSVAQIGAETGVTASAVRAMLKRLKAKGWAGP